MLPATETKSYSSCVFKQDHLRCRNTKLVGRMSIMDRTEQDRERERKGFLVRVRFGQGLIPDRRAATDSGDF